MKIIFNRYIFIAIFVLFDKLGILKNKHINIFFCGIGGIGTSGLALLSNSLGYNVYGSNIEKNSNTEKLIQNGIDVRIGHSVDNLQKCDVFVYTTAIDLASNVEVIEAKSRRILMLNRGEFLSFLMLKYYNIVIAGSHGKTTTTGLIGHILSEIGKKPNVLVGGVLNDCNTNCKVNKGKYFVVESDESDGSFLSMPSNIGVITSLDPEHMEFYETTANLERYFFTFIKRTLKKDGVVICIDSKMCLDIVEKIKSSELKQEYKNRLITYSFNNKEADFYSSNIQYRQNGVDFDIHNNIDNVVIKNVFLKNLYGDCNVLNAIGSACVLKLLHFDIEKSIKTLDTFDGIQKRFTIVGKINNMLVIDDYAHNPQKISACIDCAKHYMKSNNITGKLVCVFEPHRYTRVRDSIELFSKSLKDVDDVLVLPIYASSEQPISGITQEYVVKECLKNNKNIYSCSLDKDEIRDKLIDICKEDAGLIVFMGAGKSSKISRSVVD